MSNLLWKLSPYKSIIILDSIQRPVFYLKHDVSETEFCLRRQMEPSQMGPIKRASLFLRTSSLFWAQLSRFHLKTKTESIFRNIVF
jgi:hypothetical protein